MAEQERSDMSAPPLAAVPLPRSESALVPRNSISGRALVAVVAIMTFLASLTTGAVILVSQAASEWQSDVSREVTIQLIPAPGRNLDALVDKAASVARAFPGIAEVRPYSKEESSKLLEPWLGSGLSLSELPVPRLIVVKIGANATPDIPQLRAMLAEQVPGATLDDHRGWIDRMRAMAGTAVAAGICVLILMIAATVLSVTFATKGAMATNKTVIEVLHFVGAKNGFIAANFQRHFLLLGLQGGAIGGGAAVGGLARATHPRRGVAPPPRRRPPPPRFGVV
jgi:cell division transport system permease protein